MSGRVIQVSCLAMACAALVAAFFAPRTLLAQSSRDSIQTPRGVCRVWQMPPGGSTFPTDASYSRCALDRGPTLRPDQPLPQPPRYGRRADDSFVVIVNADGTVDPDRTRALSSTGDTAFHRGAIETIRGWRFDPGVRQGTPVRSGFLLAIHSDSRNDTLPARLEWRYESGLSADTLRGTWTVEAPLPPFISGQVDSIYAAMLRRLMKMQVVLPHVGEPYCIVPEQTDSATHAHYTFLANGVARARGIERPIFAGYGCERSPLMLRILLPRIHRTENGRAVLESSGDYLPNWPPGIDGRSWRAWSARCLADVPVGGSVWLDCDVRGQDVRREITAWGREEREARRRATASDADSVRIEIVVTMDGAFQMDTLTATVPPLPRFSERAIVDSNPPCGSWNAYSLQDSSELYIVKGDPTRQSLDVTRVVHTRPPTPRSSVMRCGRQEPRISQFVTFLLGDLGDRPTSPITVCFSGCARSYVLDPALHTMVDRAHVVFRPKDLREDTRVGDQVRFRIRVDPASARLVPLVVVRSPAQRLGRAWIARPATLNAWDYAVTYTGGFPKDAEVHIYLLVR